MSGERFKVVVHHGGPWKRMDHLNIVVGKGSVGHVTLIKGVTLKS